MDTSRPRHFRVLYSLLIGIFTLSSIPIATLFADPGALNSIIPADRRVNWTPGIPGGIPEVPIVRNVADYGATPNDGIDDREAIQNAIWAASGKNGAVFFPAGVYDIKTRTHDDGALYLPSGVVLRGEGADRTTLQFNLSAYPSSAVAGIKVLAWDYGNFTNVTAGYNKGSTQLTVADASSFHVGDYAEIQEINDANIGNEGWAKDAVGEMVRIVAVNGVHLTLEKALHYNYEANRTPKIRKVGVVSNSGIERMHLKRTDSGSGAMIFLYNVANVWVREVESEYVLESHVYAHAAYQCEIRDSYFHHAWGYGTGGQGYGVNLVMHVTNTLVENNIFRKLRHALIAQVGANGNVFAYNYSTDRNSSLTDVSVHGHWASYNLYEGNIVQEVNDSDYWGASGPGNTFFRTCVQAEGIQLMNNSDNQNIVGNVLGASPNVISEDSTIQGTLIHGNYENGGITWDPTISDHTLPNSYYLHKTPRFYQFQGMNWPSTGPDIITNPATCTNPARQRWSASHPIPHDYYLRSALDGDDVQLNWVHRYENSHYEVWSSASPYFSPADTSATRIAANVTPPTLGDAASYTIPDVTQTTYYRIRGMNGATPGASSGTVGIFVQSLGN